MKSKKKNKKKIIPSTGKKSLIVFLVLLVIVPAVLYFRVVNFEFTMLDDAEIIVTHYDKIGSLLNIKDAFTHDAIMSDRGESFYRPMQTISFMLDAQIGGKEPWIYHLTNLLLHILIVVSLFFFLKKIGLREEISFLLALLFSIHPLLTNAIAWVPARGDLLICFFTLLSFIFFLNYYKTRKIVYLILHSFVFLLAVFSKETALIMPTLVLLYLYFVLKEKLIIKNIIPFLIIWLLSFILYYCLRQNVVKALLPTTMSGVIPIIRNLPTIPITFGKFFFPYNLSTLPLYDILSLILGILLIIIFITFTIKAGRGKDRIIIWGAIWFLVFSFPPLLFRTYHAEIAIEYYEYRTYLPIIGILAVIGILINELPKRFSFRQIMTGFIPIILIYGAIASGHSSDFSNPIEFFSSGINANSNNAWALNGRGIIYEDTGNMEKALTDFDNSIRICSTYSAPYFSKGDLYRNLGDYPKAEYFYSMALNYDTLYNNFNSLPEDAYLKHSATKIILKKYDEALVILNKAKNFFPRSPKIYNNMGYIYFSEAKYDSAINCFSRAIEIEPNSYSYTNRATCKYKLKEPNGALSDFKEALKIDPGDKNAYLNRGIIKIDMFDYDGAISDLNYTLSLDPNSADAYYYRGNAWSKLNKLAEAEKDWAEARKLGLRLN